MWNLRFRQEFILVFVLATKPTNKTVQKGHKFYELIKYA